MLLWQHTFFLCDVSPHLSSLSRSFSWEVNKLNQIWFIMSNCELKSKLNMLSRCTACLFRFVWMLWETWHRKSPHTHQLTASVVPYMNRGGQYNTKEKSSPSFYPLLLSSLDITFFSTSSSNSFTWYACLSLTWTQPHTHTECVCVYAIMHRHREREPHMHKCEVISTLIHPRNYELQCV